MKRRTLLKHAGVGSLALVAASNTLGTTALASGKIRFAFGAAAVADSGRFVGDVALLDGSGKFGGDDAEGGGRLTHFHPATGAVVATASWRAKKLTSFVQSGSALGTHLAGLATLEIEVRPDNGGEIAATLRISCHLPGRPDPALPEGIDITSAAVGHFRAFPGTSTLFARAED